MHPEARAAPASPSSTVVAVHGNGGGAFRFERVRPHLPPDVRFEAVTLPGFAATAPDPRLVMLRDFAEHLRGQLDGLPRPIVLLGHGIGGSIALEAAQRPDPGFDALLLHAPVGARLEERAFPKLMALPGARTLGRYAFSSRAARPFLRRLLFSEPPPADYLDRFFDEYRACAVFGQMFEIITPRWFASLRPVALPAALLWGERERVLGPEQLEDFRPLLPIRVERRVAGWDHFPMIEQPEEYARVVAELARELLAMAASPPEGGTP